MLLSGDAKFGLGVLLATVIIIGGAAWYGGRSQQIPAEPQRVEESDRLVRADDPVLGSQEAAVIVVEFGDFECPACGSLHPVLQQVKEQYREKPVRFVFRQFPLTQIHEHAQLAAEASLAAGAQGKFWEYHDRLFENQSSLTREDLERHAQELGLNMDEFRVALDEHKYAEQVAQDVADGAALGVPGTPTLFINDTAFAGPYSLAELTRAIDERL